LILVSLSQQAKPAQNRRLSTSASLAFICAGFMFHSILPRCWHIAFGEFQVPAAPAAAGTWQAEMKSKANRVSLWLSMDDAQTSTLILCYCCAPAEHLLQVFQRDDSAGGLLRSVQIPRSSPVVACLEQYWRMLQSPAEEMRVLLRHLQPQGLLLISVVMSCVFALVLSLAAGIWRDIHMAATTWPFRLTALTLDNEALFKDTSDALFSASACCLDKRFTGKLRSLVGSPEGLKAADAVLDAVRVWSWRKRFDNMSTERLLKRYRVASPSHPDVVRSCAAGFLSEVQHAHQQNGGSDLRHMTRARLLARDAPIRSSALKIAKRHVKQRRNKLTFLAWAATMQKAGRAAAGVRGRTPLGNREAFRARMADLKEMWRAGNRPLLELEEAPLASVSYADCIGNQLGGYRPRIGRCSRMSSSRRSTACCASPAMERSVSGV
jgi:hypothetical protein